MQTATLQSPYSVGGGFGKVIISRTVTETGRDRQQSLLHFENRTRMEGTLRTVLLLAFATSTSAIYLQDTIVSNYERHVLIAKYCFAYSESVFEYEITYPMTYRVQKLFLATESDWEYGQYDCNTLESRVPSKQTIELTPDNPNSGCQSMHKDGFGEIVYWCVHRMTFRSDVPRKWHVVLARCGLSEDYMSGLRLNYTMHMTNGPMEMESDGCIDDLIMSAGVSTHTAQWTAALILAAITAFTLLL